jgi:roadblock/LC7 domain-containing protein
MLSEGEMSRTTELMAVPGVVAAGIYSRKGLMAQFEGDLPEAEAVGLVNLCSALTLIMEMEGRLLGRIASQPGWNGRCAWMMWGSEKAIMSVDDTVCVAQAGSTSFNQLMRAMQVSAGVELFKPAESGESHHGSFE